MFRKIYILMILFSCNYFLAIAGNKYAAADAYLQDADYEMANSEYLKIIEDKGPISFSKDIRALTGAFISSFMMQKYKKSLALTKRVFKLQSYNSSAIFYAGKNLEALGKIPLSKKIYKYYAVLSLSDPYRPFIKARFDYINKREIIKRVSAAIQTEGRAGAQNIPENSLAILYLANDSDDETWDTFSKGFCQLMINDLSYIKNLKLIDRIELQVLLDELKFDHTQLMDENLIPRLGRLLKAKNIVSGSFRVDFNSQLSINIATINLDRPDIVEQTEFTGDLDDLFQLEKKILKTVLNELDIPVAGAAKGNMNSFQTKNLDAFLAYCDGLDALDLNNYDLAFDNFSQAVKFDPRFYLATEMQQTIDASMMIDQGNLAMSHFQIMKKGSFTSSFGAGTSISILQARLQNISNNLDLSYLPGSESRNGGAGMNLSDIQLNEPIKLGTPPGPPPSN